MLFLVWAGNMGLLWIAHSPETRWRALIIDLLALFYFYRRWSSPDPQHRTFHYILMCSYLATSAYYFTQYVVSYYVPTAIAMSSWWFFLFSNVLFAAELLFVIVYAILRRRAQSDRMKWHQDTDSFLKKTKISK